MLDDLMPFDLPQQQNAIIKVLGVGGGGSNAVNHMWEQGIKDVDFVICNTDEQALKNSNVPIKLQLGSSLTEGRGAGNKPEIGRQAAIENIEDVKNVLSKSTKMVFITAGMGGGTGTGAAPVIAKAAKDLGILTVGIVTIPFRFEGQRRIDQAIEGISELTEHVDSLLVINNEKLRELSGDLKISEAFSMADNILTVAAKGIAEIITVHGHLNVDFADVQTVMTNSGVALMGSASAEGKDRAINAIKIALNSPLLNNNDIKGAKNILLNITSGAEEATMDEISTINEFVQEASGYTADLIWGNTYDERLGDKISVTVIATGFQTDIIPEIYSEKRKKKDKVDLIDTKSKGNNTNNNNDNNLTGSKRVFTLDSDDIDSFADDFVFNNNDPQKKIVKNKAETKPQQTTSEVKEALDNFGWENNKTSEKAKPMAKQAKNKVPELPLYLDGYIEKIDELENVPAYVRRQMVIENGVVSVANNVSRFSITEDANKNLKINDNNTFLYDRVD